jgi:hypothetical protein
MRFGVKKPQITVDIEAQPDAIMVSIPGLEGGVVIYDDEPAIEKGKRIHTAIAAYVRRSRIKPKSKRVKALIRNVRKQRIRVRKQARRA